MNPDAAVRISAFRWVPPLARGQVRDLRVRWALEEAGIDYAVRRIDFRAKPDDYFAEQPFGQVPAYRDDTVGLFETGAIVLHIGERSEALLPADPAERARATAWMFAALNSVEPYLQQLGTIDFFHPDAAWAKERRPEVARMAGERLDRVTAHLGDREYLEGRFTAGDLLMSTVLRIVGHTDLVEQRPALAAYKARCEARLAFAAALAAQLADFDADPVAA